MLRKEAEYRAKERKISFAKVIRHLSVPCTALIPTG